jgi:hypothetical protein
MNHTEHKSQISPSANLMTGAYVGDGASIERAGSKSKTDRSGLSDPPNHRAL